MSVAKSFVEDAKVTNRMTHCKQNAMLDPEACVPEDPRRKFDQYLGQIGLTHNGKHAN